MKIAYVISSMRTGGAERACALLVNAWAKRGDAVYLITLDRKDVQPFYALDPGIQLVQLDARKQVSWMRKPLENLRRILAIRKTVKDIGPDVIIASVDQINILTILASRGSGTPVFVTEQVDPRKYPLGFVWDSLRLATYGFSSGIVAVSEGVKEFFPRWLRKKITVIPNPVAGPANRSTARDTTIVAMGRLQEQKGFDLLIEAFSRISAGHPGWKLHIWGEGPLRGKLEEMITSKHLEGKVTLPGITQTPHEVLLRSGIFVLSSRFEGFPLVLAEAMSCGMPVISFDCPSGPSEMIRHGENGVLVPAENVSQLAEAMERLITHEDERRRYGEKATEILSLCGVDQVIARWDALISR